MEVISLKKYLKIFEEANIQQYLNGFKSINSEIENFIKEKAINFEKSSISSTYLIIDNIDRVL